MGAYYLNGVRLHHGPRFVEKKASASVSTYGVAKELVVNFDYENLPVAEVLDSVFEKLPAHCYIEKALLQVGEAWVGGTSLAVELSNGDTGAVLVADGLVTATQGATANLGANAVIVGTGATVGAGIGAVPAHLRVTAVGTYTAGTAKLVVRYIPV